MLSDLKIGKLDTILFEIPSLSLGADAPTLNMLSDASARNISLSHAYGSESDV